MEKLEQTLYFDPFAENGEELFNPEEAFEALAKNYEQGKVIHNNAADEFVARTEALMMDTVFVERFEAAAEIAARIHQLCGEDHDLRQSLQNSEYLSGINGDHHEGDGHNHEAKHTKNDDDDAIDPKTGKKKKKKNRWLY